MSKLAKEIKRRPWVAIDTETYGNIKKNSVYHPSIKLAYVSYFTKDGKGDVISYADDPERVRHTIRSFFEDNYICIFWNAPFDLPVLAKEELRPTRCIIQDAMVLGQTIHPLERRFGLKEFAKRFLKVPYLEEDQLKRYIRRHKCDYGSVPMDVMYPYALADAQYTFELYYLMIQHLDRLKMWDTWELETRVQSVSLSMMRTGVGVDHERVRMLEDAAQDDVRELRKSIAAAAGPHFNPNSPDQVAALLWPENDRKHRPARFTKTGKPSTDNLSLLLDGRPIALSVQKYRQYSKAIGTYYRPLSTLPVDGILHCSLNQNKAVTGRFSSSGPNLQNQPRPSSTPLGRIRECYVPLDSDSFLLLIDFDQIEMKLAAHFGQEDHMLDAIRRGADLHANTRDRMFKQEMNDEESKSYRYVAKKLNFATVYGIGPEKFANSLLEDTGGSFRISQGESRLYIDAWWDAHPGIRELRNRVLSEVARTGGVRTAFGRFIPVQSGKDHAALNYLIQGTAADVIKLSMVRVHKLLQKERARTKLLLPVHDELIFNMHRDEKHLVPELVSLMSDRTNFEVPLTCSVEAGLRWGTKKPVVIS